MKTKSNMTVLKLQSEAVKELREKFQVKTINIGDTIPGVNYNLDVIEATPESIYNWHIIEMENLLKNIKKDILNSDDEEEIQLSEPIKLRIVINTINHYLAVIKNEI